MGKFRLCAKIMLSRHMPVITQLGIQKFLAPIRCNETFFSQHFLVWLWAGSEVLAQQWTHSRGSLSTFAQIASLLQNAFLRDVPRCIKNLLGEQYFALPKFFVIVTLRRHQATLGFSPETRLAFFQTSWHIST